MSPVLGVISIVVISKVIINKVIISIVVAPNSLFFPEICAKFTILDCF